MAKGINRFLLVLILIFSVSCGRNVVFTDSAVMDGKVWRLANMPEFRIPVKDTLNSNNILFTIRTGSSYPYRNIYLFVTTTSPEGNSLTDTLQYNLADEKGEWYGKGFGDIHELSLPYKTNVFFPVKGTYQVKVQHGMRIEDLKGVYDLGIKVEKTVK
ncbi:MAG: gliding motility lipoprotein GldH [Bacteroidales bacterium]